jgi:hypothetical protein
MRSNHFTLVMPAQRHPAAERGGDPVFAGIHGFLPPPYPPPQAGEGRVGEARMAGTRPAMTPNNGSI